jgi:proton-dependent oligopeptide transporter, POT family
MRDPSGGHPRVLFALALVAACEVCAFYGIRSLITTGLGQRFDDLETLGSVYGLFTMVAGTLPILAGIAADLAGARRTAMAGGVIAAAGMGILALPGTSAVYVGLGLLALGSALSKVGVVALVADLYQPGDHRRDAGFTLLALFTNLGAFLGPLGIGGFALDIDLRLAVGSGAAAALASVAVLALCRPAPAERGPAALIWPAGRAVAVFAVLVLVVETFELAVALLDTAAYLVPGGLERSRAAVLPIVASVVGFLVAAGLLAWLWLRLGDRQPSSPAKILLGAVLVALALFVVIALARGGMPEALGPLATTPIAIAADLLVVTIALSLVGRLARPRFRGTILGLWMSAPRISALILPSAERALLETRADLALVLLPGAALAAGLVGYALLRLLRATEA